MRKYFVLFVLIGSVLLAGCPAKSEPNTNDRIPEVPPSTRGTGGAPAAPK